MKIAFVTPAFYPAKTGSSLYSTELALNLKRNGHAVKVFTPLVQGLKPRETVDGIEVTRPKITQITESYYVSSGMIKAVLKDRFDIIHSHHYGYFPATAGLVAAKLSKTAHVFGPYYHPPVYGTRRWLLFSAYHLTQGLPLLRLSERILPHTEYERKMLLKIGAREDAMSILPNLVNTRKFRPAGKKENIVLFVGNLIQERGASVALDMADRITKRTKDVKFVFIGNAYHPEIIRKIESLRKNSRIKFLSNLKLDELVRWYQRASLLMLPSKYEAFSRIIAEAEACGCAIVATRVGGVPEVVKDGRSGFLVDYGNWAGMEQKIEYLLGDPKARRKMGAEGSKHISSNFDTRIVVKKLEKIYSEIV